MDTCQFREAALFSCQKTPNTVRMLVVSFCLQIIFYEDKNFQGRSYDTNSDCNDLNMHLSRCNSCRVNSGCCIVYDRSNFMGNQMFLKRGEYSDFQRMGSMGMGMLDDIHSCRMIPMVRQGPRLTI